MDMDWAAKTSKATFKKSLTKRLPTFPKVFLATQAPEALSRKLCIFNNVLASQTLYLRYNTVIGTAATKEKLSESQQKQRPGASAARA